MENAKIKPGYKTSEFWFTLVTFLFSGLYLAGVIGDNQVKEDFIQETNKGVEATILIIGQITILCRYIRGRNELKRLWWTLNFASEEPSVAPPVIDEPVISQPVITESNKPKKKKTHGNSKRKRSSRKSSKSVSSKNTRNKTN